MSWAGQSTRIRSAVLHPPSVQLNLALFSVWIPFAAVPSDSRRRGRFLSALVSVAVLLSWLPGGITSADEVDFNRDIRPILSVNCVFCHGPDDQERQAGLRLDLHDEALSVIAAGSRQDSELMHRLLTDDEDALMPPPDSNRRLSAEQLELIGKWIDEGAKWEKHWSFTPIVRPAVPKIGGRDSTPVLNPIDAFVQTKLAKTNLDPSPAADRRTLIRRLSLDLTGLPPTPDEVEAFLGDKTENAYAELVDRLLDSPAYGQRMAWNWLDAARYADTNGYQGDRERTMYPWRDWVVDALNQNMPYDQFTIWQLAGDSLPDATHQQILATGFLRNHMINGEGGRIAEENRVEYAMDMLETVGTVWLGLTLNCCRCHDHKYDPITNEEYYQLFAFFNQTPVTGQGGDAQTAPNLAAPSEDQETKLADLSRELANQDAKLRAFSRELSKSQSEWEERQAKRMAKATKWSVVNPSHAYATGSRTRILKDGSVLAAATRRPDNNTYTVIANPQSKSITGVRLEVMQHDSLPNGRLSHSASGNFVLTGFEVSVTDDENGSGHTPVKIESAQATFQQTGHRVESSLDSKTETGWAVYDGTQVKQSHAAAFTFSKPVVIPKGAKLEFVLRHDSKHKKHNIGRFRLSLSESEAPRLSGAADALVAALQVPREDRSETQIKAIAKAHRDSNADYATLQKRRDAIVKQRNALEKKVPKVMVMRDRENPRDTFVLERGLYNKPTAPVKRAFPKFLPSKSIVEEEPNRLELAQWLVSDDHPLTARVTVNRVWQQFFGIGIVKTTEDFGRQGELPVHRELLDWLAADFRDGGWDLKELVRTIVSSHTYRQSSVTSSLALELDPKNRLLSRASRFRMPSWMLRDQALAISGLLSANGRGPGVNSYQPAGVWEEASFGKKTYQRDSGEKLYRRSLYTFWRRIIGPTMFFDAATRQTCSVKPGRTNTPLHALQTLNNTQFVEAARVLAERTLLFDGSESGAGKDARRIDYAMTRALGRNASAQEHAILQAGLARTRRQYRDDESAASKLLSVGESPREHSIDTREHACWTALCLAILNFDETLSRE